MRKASMRQARQLVLAKYPDATVYESQINFQKTFNIKCSEGFLGWGFSLQAAWLKALKQVAI